MEEHGRTWRYPLERQHVVKNPIIFNHDIDLQRRMFWEAAQSTGVLVDFYNCVSDKSDFNNDPNIKWDDRVILPVIFDDAPKVKIIKELGWYTEDDERPMLAYLPIYKDWTTKELLRLHEQSLMRIYYYGQSIPSEFRVMDKRLDSIYGVYWICKLAPERLDKFVLVEESGRHFLKLDIRNEEKDTDYDKGTDNRYEHDEDAANILYDNTSDGYFDEIMNGESENTTDFYKSEDNEDDVIQKKNRDSLDTSPDTDNTNIQKDDSKDDSSEEDLYNDLNR